MLENFRSKFYYKIVGCISWILAPYIMYLLGTPSFAAIGAAIVAALLTIALVILYLLLLIIAAIDSKRLVKKSTNKFFDFGYIFGFVPIFYLLFNYLHYLLSR